MIERVKGVLTFDNFVKYSVFLVALAIGYSKITNSIDATSKGLDEIKISLKEQESKKDAQRVEVSELKIQIAVINQQIKDLKNANSK